MSYKPQFDTGDLVVTPQGNIGIVESSSQYREHDLMTPHMHYVIKCGSKTGTYWAHVAGEVLRTPKYREFAWWYNPETSKRSIGRTRLWEAVLIHVFGAIVIACSKTVVQPGWNVLVAFIGIAPIAAVWVGVKRNLTKKWV